MIGRPLRRLANRWRHRAGRHATLFEPYRGDECVSIDCETTGLDPKTAHVLSIGAVRVRANRVLTSEALDLLLQPPERIDAASIRIHRIRAIDLADGLPPRAAMEQLLAFVGNRPLLGYHIAYDFAVINRLIAPQFGFTLPNRSIELADVYRRRLRSGLAEGADVDLRLETIAAKLGMPDMQARHTALGDAISVAMMYVRLKNGAAIG